MVRPTVNSQKHYVQWTITPVSVGTTVGKNIALGTVIANINLGTEVREGAIVKAVYLELWAVGQSDTASGNVLINFYKKPGAGTSMTHAEAIDLDSYDNKKNVLYHTQGLVNIGLANAIPFVRGWMKIPKGKQRMGLNDALAITVSTEAEATNFCGFATYKEYF